MNPQKARSIAHNAIAAGKLKRPGFCSRCGKPDTPARDGRTTIQAHHPDYSKPLDVEWLCVKCHRSEKPQRGEENSIAKLTNAQAESIRNDPRPQRLLARIYGVDRANIRRIKQGKAYANTR